ncbi:unnamed protein product [Amaranthus hypochondriacus]
MAGIREEDDSHTQQNIIYGIDFNLLPEGCIASVFSFTTPRDACRFASISAIFKSAADSDSVWDRFLPSDYHHFLQKAVTAQSLFNSLSKKQLFMRLADFPLLIDDGAMSFSLDKSTGKKCFMISARNLAIIWSDTPRYWAWNPDSKSRFSEVAELVTVCWLEIKGKMKTSLLSTNTEYAAYLVFKMKPEAFGFYTPVEAVVQTAAGKVETQDVYLVSRDRYQLIPRIGVFNQFLAPVTRLRQGEREDETKLPKDRSDEWQEIKIGEFSTAEDEDGEVEFSVLEVKAGNWKGGLLVEGIEIRPKYKEAKV